MNKEDYIKIANEKLDDKLSKKMIDQIERYYMAKKYVLPKNKYKIGDSVKLKKGTLLHGTYKNIDGLRAIAEAGLLASWFINERITYFPSSVCIWDLNEDYLLKEYINFYSGGTINYSGTLENGEYTSNFKISVIPYNKMNKVKDIITKNQCRVWSMEQTKEAKFLPNLAQDLVQIGIIFNGDNEYAKELIKADILNPNFINNHDIKQLVKKEYYDNFVVGRVAKQGSFTDREKAILFGIPSNLIEGILVGRKYEKDVSILKEIKSLLPNCYICNLDGTVIY